VYGILSCFQPDYIILETTGAANPLNLLDEIVELETQVRYDCTVTVVDALNLDSTLSQFAVAADQIRAADVLLLNKCDLVSEVCLQKAHKLLQDIQPNAIVFMTTQGDLNPALIFDVEDRLVEKKNASPVVSVLKFPLHTSHVHDGLWCKTLPIPVPLNRKDFLSAVESLPPTVFRVKGILEFSDSPHPMLFQYVAGRFELSLFHQPVVADRFLTVIAQGNGQEGFLSFISTASSPAER
jgi:G3E family GTPase